MQLRRIVLFCATLALGLCPLFAASPDSNIVITLNGTLGFVSGEDCLSENDAAMTATATFSSSATPTHISVGGTLVTYKLPRGAVTVSFSSGEIPNFTSTMPWKAVFSSKAQTLELSGGTPHGRLGLYIHIKLKRDSWSDAILQHPTAFSPSPQNVMDGGFAYHRAIHPCGADMGFTGTASN